MTKNALDIPKFLRRKVKVRRVRRVSKEKVWITGVPVKRPTKGQTKVLVKRGWTYQQVMNLSKSEAEIIIRLNAEPDDRFSPLKKNQFPDKKDDE